MQMRLSLKDMVPKKIQDRPLCDDEGEINIRNKRDEHVYKN